LKGAEHGRDHGPSIKDDEQYEALRAKGMGKEKAARIANSDRVETARRGGASQNFETMTVDELYERAQEVDLKGRSGMDRRELIEALRDR